MPTEREKSVTAANRMVTHPHMQGPNAMFFARGLLAEHEEVLAGRKEIARLKDNATTSTALALKNASDFARDLTATQGTLRRLRAAILAGATDAAQAMALTAALDVLDTQEHGSEVDAARTFLACSEALREARAEVATLREQARAMAEST